MEKITKFRHNVMGISDIRAFQSVYGEVNDGCKDVYFVRAVGTNASYLSDIQKMDESLLNNMNDGKGYYHRLDCLPKMQSAEDINFYSNCYADWIAAGRKELLTKVTCQNRVLAEMLSSACIITEDIFKKENTQATDSIIKNFLVKLMFWYDSVFTDKRINFDDKLSMKIVVSNIIKKQEYLFFYLVTLMGCDVLLLQNKGDIGAEEEKLNLSSKFVLGDFSEITIPVYQWRDTKSLQETTNSNGRITVKIPERNRPSRHPAQNVQGTQVGAFETQMSQTCGTQGNPRVVIPPRPGAGQTNPQVTIPSRPGASQANPQVTIPPRPGASQARTTVSTPVRPVASVAAGLEAEKSFEELALLASSVVLITVYDGKGERLGSGSGIMIGKEGYILTNNHVAAGGRCFSVRIEDDENEYRTDEIIKYHSVLDLAIIRIQRKLNPIPVYKGSKPLVRGQKVVAIGSPLGLFNSVSNGIISGFRKIDEVDMIQFTAPTSRGSSGGAVLNMQGEVIGISTAGIDAGQNINLAMGYECINMFIRGFI